MKELMSIIPYVLFPLSMAAAVTVVFVAAFKILGDSFCRATAVVLALGITILAVVGTAQIVLVRSQPAETAATLLPSGSALLVLPFVTLAIAPLLAQVLVAVSAAVPEGRPGRTAGGSGNGGPMVKAEPEPLQNVATPGKPRGRPRKPLPEQSSQPPRPDDVPKKTSSPKQQHPAGAEAMTKQRPDGTAGSTQQA
jgi:hypothetical protein